MTEFRSPCIHNKICCGTHHKPKNLQELKDRIRLFWLTLTPEVCQRYIGHLHKVMPKIVEVEGDPSGY